MFKKEDLKKFKLFNLQNQYSFTKTAQSRYVFLEDSNEILSIHGTSFEVQPFKNASGQIISIWTNNHVVFPNQPIVVLLRGLIRFIPLVCKENVYPQDLTFLGRYDMNLIPITSVTSSFSLLPSTTTTEQIYLTDLSTKPSPTYFIEQFASILWIAFLITFLLSGLILDFGSWYLNKFIFRPFISFHWFSIVTQQGGDEPYSTRYRKIILISIALLTIIFHGSFEAFLSSSLAIRNIDLPFSDLNGLLNAKDYTICTIQYTAPYDYMQSQQLQDRHNTNKCPQYFREFSAITQSSKSNLTKCPDGKFAYMGFGVFWMAEWNDKCNFVPLAETYFRKYITMSVSPGFKYREQFNAGIIQIMSRGHHRYLQLQQHEHGYFDVGLKHGRYQHIEKRESTVQSIDTSQIVYIQMFLIGGILCSIFVLLAEKITKFKQLSIKYFKKG